jgi:hypothetical protein
MKLRTLPLVAALLFSPVPAVAQDLSNIFGPGPNPITMFKELFKADPLTPAEEVRLPAAQQVADSLMPPGSYGRMLQDSFAPMAEKVLAMAEADDAARVAGLTKLSKSDLAGVEKAKLAQIIAMLDPKAKERNKQMVDFAFAEISAAMVKVEPHYRAGLARAYARHYNAAQLAELNAFFATPTGGLFASRSLAMNVDPQVMATFPDMVPVLVGHVAEAATRFVLAMDTIPQARNVDELSARDRAQLLGLLGLSDDEYTALTTKPAEIEWDDSDSEEWDFGDEFEGGVEETSVDGGLEVVD